METKVRSASVKAEDASKDCHAELNRVLEGERIEIRGPVPESFTRVLTPEALRFVVKLARRFEPTRSSLLQKRVERQAEIDTGKMPDFLPETAELRRAS